MKPNNSYENNANAKLTRTAYVSKSPFLPDINGFYMVAGMPQRLALTQSIKHENFVLVSLSLVCFSFSCCSMTLLKTTDET